LLPFLPLPCIILLLSLISLSHLVLLSSIDRSISQSIKRSCYKSILLYLLLCLHIYIHTYNACAHIYTYIYIYIHLHSHSYDDPYSWNLAVFSIKAKQKRTCFQASDTCKGKLIEIYYIKGVRDMAMTEPLNADWKLRYDILCNGTYLHVCRCTSLYICMYFSEITLAATNYS
jgi:hypothetical protein